MTPFWQLPRHGELPSRTGRSAACPVASRSSPVRGPLRCFGRPGRIRARSRFLRMHANRFLLPAHALIPTETPRSGNRLAHVAWVTRVCVDHLRHGDVYLRDEEPQRLCWKCHRLQPVTAFEVRCVPACAAARR